MPYYAFVNLVWFAFVLSESAVQAAIDQARSTGGTDREPHRVQCFSPDDKQPLATFGTT